MYKYICECGKLFPNMHSAHALDFHAHVCCILCKLAELTKTLKSLSEIFELVEYFVQKVRCTRPRQFFA